MKYCTFELNNRPVSEFIIENHNFPAFSGLGVHVNKRASICMQSQGPIPVGEYFILDRESGGRLGWLYNLFNDKRDWFALYANDGHIDDRTWCGKVERGEFRLHPEGPLGLSHGCIVIKQLTDFQTLSRILRSGPPTTIPGTDLNAWGKVVVR